MVRYILIISLISSCSSIDTKLLDDGYSKVPVHENFFDIHYRNKYEISIPKSVDTKSIYIAEFFQDYHGKIHSTISTDEYDTAAIRFYENACVSKFSLPINDSLYTYRLNPNKTGYRGICYKKGEDFYIGWVSPKNHRYTFGKTTRKISIVGDTLFVRVFNKALGKFDKSKHIYLRKPLSEKNLQYQADW